VIVELVLQNYQTGDNLRALAALDNHFGRISRVLNRIHTDERRSFIKTQIRATEHEGRVAQIFNLA